MAKKPRKPDSKDKAAAESASIASPMERFKTLARRLAKVPRDELEEQQRRYEADKARRRRKP